MSTAYEEVAEFIAASIDPDVLLAFRPSESARHRVAELLEGQSSGDLSHDEQEELQAHLFIERLMRRAKAAARRVERTSA